LEEDIVDRETSLRRRLADLPIEKKLLKAQLAGLDPLVEPQWSADLRRRVLRIDRRVEELEAEIRNRVRAEYTGPERRRRVALIPVRSRGSESQSSSHET
jgi:hypothetical protein